jgi:hypothetical protein
MSCQVSAISYQQLVRGKLAIVTQVLSEDFVTAVLGAVGLAPLTADC